MDRSLRKELAPGYVLHLDPDELEKNGGSFNCSVEARVVGAHFFLCVSQVNNGFVLLPLFTSASPGRVAVSRNGRTGHEKWTNGTFHFHPGQVWSASSNGVAAAAHRGKDQSKTGNRNCLAHEHLPVV